MGWLLALVFQKLLTNWDFPTQPSLGFTEGGLKKRKFLVSSRSLGKNMLLMTEVRRE